MAKVLIVDDSLYQLKTINRLLVQLGHDVTATQKSTEVIGMLEAEEYDCLLTDLLMPEVDGIQILEQLKERNLKVPAIVLSANIQKSVEDKCHALGAKFFLNKPPTKDSLKIALQQIARG